jgi:hypothetical protein
MSELPPPPWWAWVVVGLLFFAAAIHRAWIVAVAAAPAVLAGLRGAGASGG